MSITKTANDLSIDIFELNKTADWNGAFKSLELFVKKNYQNLENIDLILEAIKNAQDTFGQKNSSVTEKAYGQIDFINAMSNILEMDSKINKVFEKKLTEIRNNHNIGNVLREGLKLRYAFNSERSHYLIHQIFDADRFPTSALFRLSQAPCLILAEMIDDLLFDLKSIDPKETICIQYEDTDGKRKSILCKYQPINESEGNGFTATPAPYFFGTCIFDAFLIAYYYDVISKAWVGIPLDLIEKIEYKGSKNLGKYEYMITRPKMKDDPMDNEREEE